MAYINNIKRKPQQPRSVNSVNVVRNFFPAILNAHVGCTMCDKHERKASVTPWLHSCSLATESEALVQKQVGRLNILIYNSLWNETS